MAVEVKFDLKTQQVSAYLKGIPGGLERAAARAINSLNADIKDEATKGVTSVYNLRAPEVKRNIKTVRRATNRSLLAVWRAVGRPTPMEKFSPQGGLPLGKRVPITVEVFRGKRKILRGAFRLPSGAIVKRNNEGRLTRNDKVALDKKFGPAMPSAFIKDSVMGAVIKMTNRLLPVRMETEAAREIRKLATGKLPKL